jgi:hypothetical protein
MLIRAARAAGGMAPSEAKTMHRKRIRLVARGRIDKKEAGKNVESGVS